MTVKARRADEATRAWFERQAALRTERDKREAAKASTKVVSTPLSTT